MSEHTRGWIIELGERVFDATRLPPEALTEPQPRQAYAYWLEKRGQRSLPALDDVDPAEIMRLLPYLAVVDVLHDCGDYFYRIEGEAVQKTVGFRRMGRRLSEFKEQLGAAHARAVRWFETVCAVGAPVAQTSPLTALGRDYYKVEVLYLPFSQNAGRVDRIVTCIGFLARPEDGQAQP